MVLPSWDSRQIGCDDFLNKVAARTGCAGSQKLKLNFMVFFNFPKHAQQGLGGGNGLAHCSGIEAQQNVLFPRRIHHNGFGAGRANINTQICWNVPFFIREIVQINLYIM